MNKIKLKNVINNNNYNSLIFTKNPDPHIGPIVSGLGEDLEKHDVLNPDLWDNNKLKSEVKHKLLDIVDKFKDNLLNDGIKLDLKDVVIVGSNANYNYSEHSDIDLHIVANTGVYANQKELAVKLYDAYKRLFNNKYDPTIYGHEVELYVEPDNINANSNGMYSLNNGWLKFPENADIPDLDEQELHALVSEYDNKIQDADTIDIIDSIIDDLYILRQQSILKDGEYGLGNQCFKEIRNMGLLQELKDKKTQLENKSMSLTESVQELSDFNTISNYLDNLPTKYKKQIIELCNLLSASDAAFANKIIKELGLKFYVNSSCIWVRQGRNSDYLSLNKLHIPEYSKNKFKESTKVSSISLNWHNSNFYDNNIYYSVNIYFLEKKCNFALSIVSKSIDNPKDSIIFDESAHDIRH